MIPGGQIVRKVYHQKKNLTSSNWSEKPICENGQMRFIGTSIFLFAEHERNRFQGVFEGVVRDQIRSRVSELCGTCRWVSKECGFSYAAKPYVLVRSSFTYAKLTNVTWNHCLALLYLTRAQLSLSFLLIKLENPGQCFLHPITPRAPFNHASRVLFLACPSGIQIERTIFSGYKNSSAQRY